MEVRGQGEATAIKFPYLVHQISTKPHKYPLSHPSINGLMDSTLSFHLGNPGLIQEA